MTRLEPMLLHEVDRPLELEYFDCELKWDGYRAMGYGSDLSFYSRNGTNLTNRFKELYDVAQVFSESRAIVDGEIVATVDGVPSFSALQGRRAPATFVGEAYDGRRSSYLPRP